MRVATIDCGTASIRLLIADVVNGNLHEVFREMEIVKLGEGVDKNKAFDLTAIDRTLKAVDKYATEIAKRGVQKVRFCATSATRDATNRDIFIKGVSESLGIEPEVIPGVEEASLSFLGATFALARNLAPYLVVDIGGGSTEFVYGTKNVDFAKSVNIGCVRMTERHFANNPAKNSEIESARIDIQDAISSAAKEVPITKANSLIAVAGTATTVAAAALDLPTYDRHSIHLARISAAKVHEVSEMFLKMTREERLALGYMHPGRVDVIGAGSLVLSEIMKATGAKEFIASESDILDGMAYKLASS